MSPVAITSSSMEKRFKSAPSSTIPTPPGTSTPYSIAKPMDITNTDSILDTPSRRPSPWHDIAHSLSTTALPRRLSVSGSISASFSFSSTSSTIPTPSLPSPPLSTSQALREWEERLTRPSSAYSRHALLTSPTPVAPSPTMLAKLEPERDKEGHIEYKLKLINPSSDRFERLVTQMMWRLKQGRNEAIYELGLADDGTVVGLSRADMDASLRTLELMASEVGATVLVLKEIVLAGSSGDGPAARDSVKATTDSVEAPAPAKKKRGWGRKRRERREAWESRQMPLTPDDPEVGRTRRIVFDPASMDDDSDEDQEQNGHNAGTGALIGINDDVHQVEADFDEDVPPFHLDLEDTVPSLPTSLVDFSEPASPTTSSSTGSWKRRRRKQTQVREFTEEERAEHEKKATAKARKAMERRDARRLDLLRGDGMTPSPKLEVPSVYPQPGPIEGLEAQHPHAPLRPSSLRLTTPPPLVLVDADTETENKADDTLDDLLTTPLDSLSLSFADVQTVRTRSSSTSSASSTEYAPTVVDLPILGTERICVEALVVRKVQYEEEEGGWGWGGMDDVWGLSAEAYEDVEVVEHEGEDEEADDPWGF